MEALLRSCSSSSHFLLLPGVSRINHKQRASLVSATGSSPSWPENSRKKPSPLPRSRKSVIVEAKRNKNNKADTHSFVPKPNEATGPFPEAVLLKERKTQEDGNRLPEFADDEEAELFEYLQLQMESDLNLERTRHYEVVYLIHENHAEEFASINEKVQDFIREKKGRIWRLNDWGLRRLAYKIKKAKNARYILMNFELEAKWINDFKSMLDKDERVIRHLVMKKDEAETEDCPPPPEFHTLQAGMDDEDEDIGDENADDFGDEDWDGEDELILDGDEENDGGDSIIVVDADNNDIQDRAYSPAGISSSPRRDRAVEKVNR